MGGPFFKSEMGGLLSGWHQTVSAGGGVTQMLARA
jgi:hypothetical protein